ncbi:MAG: hypothetical protein LAQ69_13485 [Acidobacteriia bacterium]|nr:hypothetical protein [Terriglobia bacterium]
MSNRYSEDERLRIAEATRKRWAEFQAAKKKQADQQAIKDQAIKDQYDKMTLDEHITMKTKLAKLDMAQKAKPRKGTLARYCFDAYEAEATRKQEEFYLSVMATKGIQ